MDRSTHRLNIPACAVLLLGIAGCGSDESQQAAPGGAIGQLGLDETSAQRYTLDALTRGYVYAGAVTGKFKALSEDARADVVTEGISWARTYVESDAFEAEYLKLRSDRKPTPPVFEESVDDELERMREENLAELEETRKNVLPMMPEESRAEMEKSLETTAAFFDDPEMQKMQRIQVEQHRASEQASYESALASWNADYPEDPNELIARRIRHFLDSTADVDFDADLVEQDGLMKFDDPDYERKPAEWKMGFRAGEQSLEAAREAAAGWLDDL